MERRLWSRREALTLGGALGLSAFGSVGRSEQMSHRYASLVITGKPVAYWRLGEPEGPTAHDETRHKHEGTYHGRVLYGQPGAIRRDRDHAIGLNGTDAYIEVPDSEHFSQPTSGKGLTVEVWMRPDSLVFVGQTPEHYIHWLGKGEPGQNEWGFRFYSGHSSRPNRISAYIWNPDGGLGSGAYVEEEVRQGEWIHLVACYDAGDRSDPSAGVSIYRNGLLRGSPRTQKGALYRSYGVMPAHGRAALRFGTRDFGSFLRGGMDEIAIYPRVLTAMEIGEHYRIGSEK